MVEAPSPAFAHSKQADMMWSGAFKAVDGLDNQGTWDEITNGPALLGWQDFQNRIAFSSNAVIFQ